MIGLTIVIGTGLLALSLVAWLIQVLIKKLKRRKDMVKLGGNNKDKILGCYYLLVNGDLIFKPEYVFLDTSPSEYFEGVFVVKWWSVPFTSPTGSFAEDVKWSADWMREAYVLSTNKEKTAEGLARICETNKWPPMILDAIVNNKKIEIMRADPNLPSPAIAVTVTEGEPYA